MEITLCSEQEFVGDFNERILEFSQRCSGHVASELMMVGTRGELLANERRLAVVWSAPAASHADDVASLAGRITDGLYQRLAARATVRVSLVHALPGGAPAGEIVERRLIPFDFSRFETAGHGIPPLVNLPVESLLAGPAEAYVFVENLRGCDAFVRRGK